jgi:hypothetical protein
MGADNPEEPMTKNVEKVGESTTTRIAGESLKTPQKWQMNPGFARLDTNH